MWAKSGEQFNVAISGGRAKRMLTGVLNIKTGDYLQYASSQFKQQNFSEALRLLRSHWRGWHIVLFLDKHNSHRAQMNQQLASALAIELRWLPTACPELNPVDHLWRHLKQDIVANESTPDMDKMLKFSWDYLASLSPRQRLRKAGVLADDFWLADLLQM